MILNFERHLYYGKFIYEEAKKPEINSLTQADRLKLSPCIIKGMGNKRHQLPIKRYTAWGIPR